MKVFDKLWSQFAFYAAALVISLALQASRPDLFAIFCTPLPLENFLNSTEDLISPLNTPILPTERIK